MKPNKLALIYLGILAIIILGATFTMSMATTEVGANVAWDPRTYSWDGTPPDPWNAEVWLKGGHKAQTEIDPATILLEGLYSPSAPPYNATHGPRLIIPFLGENVKAAIFAKLPSHMGTLIPGTYRISLEITGKLYTGETFRGDGTIRVTVPNPSPP